MATGKVKWFNNAKGYGFVIAEAGGEDLFVHYSSIQMDGYKTLKAGQDVEFDIEHGPKGSARSQYQVVRVSRIRSRLRRRSKSRYERRRSVRQKSAFSAAIAQRVRRVPLTHIFAMIA